eukprot:39354_1
MASSINNTLALISILLIEFCYSTTTTLSTDCGNLIISCNDPDLTKCCQGACCSLLSQYQDRERLPIEDEIEPDSVPPYIYQPPVVVPQTIPNVGEACSSRYSREERCLGTNTKCRFDDYDSNGYLLGNCCVEHNMNGCTQDDDCCKYDGVCFEGQCTRNLPPRTNLAGTNPTDDANDVVQNAGADDIGLPETDTVEDNGVQSARSHVNVKRIDDDDTKDIDLHEENRSKPNYDLWVSLTANMIVFILVLLASLCGLNWWLYKTYYYTNKRSMAIRMNRMSMLGFKDTERECDEVMDLSDTTDFEDDP